MTASYFDLDTQPIDLDSISPQVHRLLQNGAVNDTTTFDQLDGILAQDEREQCAVAAIKQFWTTIDPDTASPEELSFAADTLLVWYAIDPRDLLETLNSN